MDHHYPELSKVLDEMRQQNELYQPSHFWQEASSRIVEEISAHGIERFRALPTPLGFFVPTYGTPGNSFTHVQCDALVQWLSSEHPKAKKPQIALEQFLCGESSALADYRVLLAADDSSCLPHLHTFSESTVGQPVEQFEFNGRRFSRSALNYLLGMAMLKQHLPAGEVPRTVLEIGGGFGTLGEILLSSNIDGLRYVDIDIPPTSFVSQWYLQQVAGTEAVTTHAMTRDQAEIQISSLKQLSVLCAWQIERLQGSVDLFVNFISFQEMEPHIVQNYLNHVSRLETKWILLRNLREGKQKLSTENKIGVKTPILGIDYISFLPSYEVIANNTLPFGHQTVDNFNSEVILLKRLSA